MTLLQIIQNLYEALGEPSDLQYLDDLDNVETTSLGWHRMVDAVNNACLGIATWKFPEGRAIRFRFLESTASLNSLVESALITADVNNSLFITTTLTDMTVDFYAGCSIKIGNLYYRIRHSRQDLINPADVDLMLDKAITTTTGTAFTISKREYFFEPEIVSPFVNVLKNIAYTASQGVPLEITNIYDSSSNSELTLTTKYEPLLSIDSTMQTPSQFYKLSGGIRFDTFPEASRSYVVRYMRGPRVLSYDVIDAVPELPEQFHEAIVLYALWWGYRRMQENNSAYSTKQDLVDTLRRARTEYDLQGELTSHQFSISFGGLS